ncbi:MAG: excinuclease ABC subunit UvrC [Clostridiales bacterium]|nr:excinuclease ABC subunit UvrC [Clostridiales bacterium]
MAFDIRENLKKLPDRPGVYLHKDDAGRIIYVGKAISLRNRVRQYFQSPERLDPKTRAMVSHIAEFEYITTGSEMEALILENNLIKKYTPQYNIMLRDDKTYPYIKVTVRDQWPRLLKTRKVESDGSRYFGPYTDVTSVNQIIEFLTDAFALKRCKAVKFPENVRPCLHYHLGRCQGICVDKGDPVRYRKDIDQVIAILEGKNKELVTQLQGEMERASENLLFEEAAVYRDRINAVKAIAEKQRVSISAPAEMDLILTAEGKGRSHGIVFFVRGGKLSGRESFPLPPEAPGDREEMTAAFLKQYYADTNLIPKEILVEVDLPEQELLEDWLSGLRGSHVKLLRPQRGEKKALMELARRDVIQMLTYLDEKAKNEEEKAAGCNRTLRELFGEILPEKGLRAEAYDISHLAGTDTVGAMVVFRDGKPMKKDYRRFRIRTEASGDDEAAMTEVLYRRMKRALTGDPGFTELPHLLLIDGGGPQVRGVEQVLLALDAAAAKGHFVTGGAPGPEGAAPAGAQMQTGAPGRLSAIPVVGMVKDSHHRSRALYFRGEEFVLTERPLLFSFIGAIQEEVHRFAIEYQRGLRQKKLQKSQLEQIPGVGEKRRNALLLHYGSIEAIAAADAAEMAALPGMTREVAENIKKHFQNVIVKSNK